MGRVRGIFRPCCPHRVSLTVVTLQAGSPRDGTKHRVWERCAKRQG